MAKILLRLVLAATAIFIVIKAFIFYKLNSEFSRAFSMIETFGQAEASYKWISSSFDGEIVLRYVSIKQPLSGIAFEAEAIRFKGPRLLDLFDFQKKLARGEFPDEFMMGLDGAKLNLINLQPESGKQAPTLMEQASAAACGKLERLGLSDLMAMGYPELMFDVKTLLRYDQDSDAARTSFNLRLHKMFDFEFSTVIDDFKEFVTQQGIPSVIDVAVNDLSYVETKNTYCAELSKSSVDEYISEHLRRVKNLMIDNSFPLSEQILTAYEAYLRKAQYIKLNITPTTQLSMTNISKYSLSDLARILGVSVNINGEEVFDIFDEKNTQREGETAQEDKKPVILSGYTFKTTAPADIKKYANHGARLTTKAGKKYEGIIVSTASDSFDLQFKVNRGRFTIPIRYDDVDKIAILR